MRPGSRPSVRHLAATNYLARFPRYLHRGPRDGEESQVGIRTSVGWSRLRRDELPDRDQQSRRLSTKPTRPTGILRNR